MPQWEPTLHVAQPILVTSPACSVLSSAADPGLSRPVAGAAPPSERPKPDELLNRMTERQAAMLMMSNAHTASCSTEMRSLCLLPSQVDTDAGGGRVQRPRPCAECVCADPGTRSACPCLRPRALVYNGGSAGSAAVPVRQETLGHACHWKRVLGRQQEAGAGGPAGRGGGPRVRGEGHRDIPREGRQGAPPPPNIAPQTGPGCCTLRCLASSQPSRSGKHSERVT